MDQLNITNEPLTLAVNPEQLAAALGISKPTAYEMLHISGFPALRVGKRWLIPCKAVERWLEDNVGRAF